jgi:hypothetical protein
MKTYQCNLTYDASYFNITLFDALLSSGLDPLEGLSMLNCGKLELGATPDFQH